MNRGRVGVKNPRKVPVSWSCAQRREWRGSLPNQQDMFLASGRSHTVDSSCVTWVLAPLAHLGLLDSSLTLSRPHLDSLGASFASGWAQPYQAVHLPMLCLIGSFFTLLSWALPPSALHGAWPDATMSASCGAKLGNTFICHTSLGAWMDLAGCQHLPCLVTAIYADYSPGPSTAFSIWLLHVNCTNLQIWVPAAQHRVTFII